METISSEDLQSPFINGQEAIISWALSLEAEIPSDEPNFCCLEKRRTGAATGPPLTKIDI